MRPKYIRMVSIPYSVVHLLENDVISSVRKHYYAERLDNKT